jgi:hypothetical protein
VEAVPRELFVGDAFFGDTTSWAPVHHSQLSREAWLTLIYSDRTLVL